MSVQNKIAMTKFIGFRFLCLGIVLLSLTFTSSVQAGESEQPKVPDEIVGYTSDVTKKSSAFLKITKSKDGYIWQSNGDKPLKHFITQAYDEKSKKEKKVSVFVNLDGAGVIVIRHEPPHDMDGTHDSDAIRPNIREYKLDSAGKMQFTSGLITPFP